LPCPGGGGRTPARPGISADFFRLGADFLAAVDFRVFVVFRFGVFRAEPDLALAGIPILRFI
jgi:hypothetical protein